MLRENRMFILWKMWYPIFRHIPIQTQIYPSISKYHHNIIIISSLELIAQTQHKLHIARTWRFFAHAARSAAAPAIGGSRGCLDFGTVVFFFHVYLQIVLKSRKSTQEIQRYLRQTWVEWLIFSELEAVAGPTYPIFVVSTMAIQNLVTLMHGW